MCLLHFHFYEVVDGDHQNIKYDVVEKVSGDKWNSMVEHAKVSYLERGLKENEKDTFVKLVQIEPYLYFYGVKVFFW